MNLRTMSPPGTKNKFPAAALPENRLVGAGLAVLFVLLALVPDEKLFRSKLLLLELGVFLAVSAWVFRAIATGRFVVRLSPNLAAVTAWASFVLLRAWAAGWSPLAAAETRRALLGFGAFWAASHFLNGSDSRRTVFRGWALGACLVSVYAVLQSTGGIGPLAVPRMERVMGTFGNPIFLGTFLSVSLPLVWGLRRTAESRVENGLMTIGFVLGVVALVLTGTRAAWIGFGVALILGYLLSARDRRGFLSLLILFGAGALVFVALTWSVWKRDQAHLLIWRDALKLWTERPVAGVGPGEFHVHFPSVAGEDLRAKWPQDRFIVNYVHNEFLQILVETGVAGLFLWEACFVLFFFRALRGLAARPPPAERAQIVAVVCAVAAGLAQSFFSADMRFSITSTLVFFLMGCLPLPGDVVRETTWRSAFAIRGAAVAAAAVLLGFVAWQRGDGGGWNFLGVFQWQRTDSGWRLETLPPRMRAGFLTRLVHPYAAQRRRNAAPDFFDEKLLDPAKTIAELEELARDHPDAAAVYEKLGYAHAKEIQTKDAEGRPVVDRDAARKALAAFERALALDPARFGPYNNIGNIHFTLGDPARAVEWWEKSLVKSPGQIDSRLNLGKIYFLNGRLKEASDHFRKVLELDPGNDEATVYLKLMVE